MQLVRPFLFSALTVLLGTSGLVACSSSGAGGSSSDPAPAAEQDVGSDSATLALTADLRTALTGEAVAGKGVRVEYALERLPQCRGNATGGPGWNIAGFYSENGSPAKTFEVTALSADGNDRVAKAARIVPSQAGDLAIWFQVTSVFGCSQYDSALGHNFHVAVKGPAAGANAAITFDKQGSPVQTGELKAGGKVKITYDQDRLPQCRRVEHGTPQWTITGFAQLDHEAPKMFETAVADGADKKTIDALVDLPHAGALALWFQVSGLDGCVAYDSSSGANYRFFVKE